MLSKNYDFGEVERKWIEKWEKDEIYLFEPKKKGKIFAVDTPPPTVSGEMHLGHACSYAQQDFIVRYKRMKGFNVFYPFGTDDNGLATERLIEKTKKVMARDMKRDEFIELCLETLKELRIKYIQDWKNIGFSADFTAFYSTINEHCRRVSQKSFIELYKIGREYRKDAPSMWCPECQTGVSQVECSDKIFDSYFNDIIFSVDGEEIIIATTRPELLPACVAVFYYPGDKRYKSLKGKMAKVPLFNFEVPIFEDSRVDLSKGTGIVMCCTFGDQTDMEWQKAYNLPIKEAIGRDGKMTSLAGEYAGLSVNEARKKIINDLKVKKLLVNQKSIQHSVNVHERCGIEIEFLKTKQWFIKYLDLKEEMLKWGNSLNWHPDFMKVRYENWVNGLQWDWLISRQRYFGVPFPVWYCKDCEEVILAKEDELPVDPLKDNPPVDKCPNCGCKEFVGENDVLDTWATSSLTPQIAAELFPTLYNELYPMDLRPQSHDIITFWLFNTLVKSKLHNNVNPWRDVMISGFVLDPHGKKMSKSKGNVIEPKKIIEKYGADALRFWAASTKLGEDSLFQEKELIAGRRMVVKLWNAASFSLMHLEDYAGYDGELELIDKWLTGELHKLIKECSESFENYEYSKVKQSVEIFFWHTFCDNYLEIIKDRLYNPDKRGERSRKSAQYALYNALLNILKLIAPVLPFVTEEIYQYMFKDYENCKSIHLSLWPEYDKKNINEKIEKIGAKFVETINFVRQEKSRNNFSLKQEVKVLTCDEILQDCVDDLKAVTKAKEVEFGKLNVTF